MMKRQFGKMGIALSALLLAQAICQPVLAVGLQGSNLECNMEDDAEKPDFSSEETAVTVTTRDEFIAALSQGKSSITISGTISIGEETVDESGKMSPVEIPANTTINGAQGASLCCRCPIQITGDNVIIKDLKLTFESSDALGSVPHREIFLAGHSLTLDNVSTYLEGNGGSFGSLGGTEDELLPTVYAGGFENTTVGTNASLTIQNANSETMFQGIYLSHDAQTDKKVPYTNKAVLNISTGTTVRDGIFSTTNSSAVIETDGSGNLSDMKFYGNEATTLNISNSNLYRASLENVGTVVLDKNSYLQLLSGNLVNVTIKNNACLDLNSMTDVSVSGNFTGGAYDTSNQIDERGILVLNKEGSLQILGSVLEHTIFHTDNRNFPGEYISEKQYIKAEKAVDNENGFMLPDSQKDYYEIVYEQGGFNVYSTYIYDYPTVSSIEIVSYPTQVDINKIWGNNFVPNTEAPYCKVIWKDEDGNPISTEIVEELLLYAYDTIIGIKTEYWQDETALEQTDWGTVVQFVSQEDTPDLYYFYISEGLSEIETGDYTFLFCSEYASDLTTVADVKALKDRVKAEINVKIYDSTKEIPDPNPDPEDPTPTPDPDPEEPTPTPEPEPDVPTPAPEPDDPAPDEPTPEEPVPTPTPTPEPETPAHTHTYKIVSQKDATCTQAGLKTYQCTGCEYNYTEEIPKKAHSTEKTLKKAAAGKNCYVVEKCKNCGTIVNKVTIYAPKAANITKLTAKSKGFTVKWKKQKSQTNGYIIEYSTNRKFTKKQTKSKTVSSNKVTSKTIKKLKANKKYYVRIRTYKNVKVNGKTVKIYSKWSKVKTVVTK